MHLQQKRGWSPRSCVPAAMCSGYAGHYRNHLTAGSLAALKRDFNITEIEGVSTRIITEALASAVEQSAYVWYARESLNALPVPVEARAVADQINDPDSKRKMPNSCRGWRPLLARRQRQVCSHSAAGRFDGSLSVADPIARGSRRGSSCSLVGYDANHWRDFRYPWPAAAAGARGACRLRSHHPCRGCWQP